MCTCICMHMHISCECMHSYRYVKNGGWKHIFICIYIHIHISRVACIHIDTLKRAQESIRSAVWEYTSTLQDVALLSRNFHAWHGAHTTKEPYISTKEAYISAKQAYISGQLYCSLVSFTVFLNILTLSLFHSLSFAKMLYCSLASSTRGMVRLQVSTLSFSIYLSLRDVVLLCRISTEWCAYKFSHSLVLTLSPSPRRYIALSHLLRVAQCA